MNTIQLPFRGNDRHYKILINAVKQGKISLWNQFVRQNGPAFKARLSGANLSGLALGEGNFRNADLRDANLSGTSLVRADFTGARLRGALLEGADLTRARLNHADLTGAVLTQAQLAHARVRGTLLINADLSGANLDGVDLAQAKLSGGSITGISRAGTRITAKIKVKVKGSPLQQREPLPLGEVSPWIIAEKKEQDMKASRIIQEEKQAVERKDQLDRKLRQGRPFFKIVP